MSGSVASPPTKKSKTASGPAFVVPPRMVDPTSYANNYDARVSSFHLNLNADFEAKVLTGYVEMIVEVLTDKTTQVLLDCKTIDVQTIQDGEGAPLKFELGESIGEFGSKLAIELAETTVGSKNVIRISYSTTPTCSAVQWLPPSQTAGKKHPYLFTQCQAIHARALLPCQDTPSNKCPFTAAMTVPAPLVALMSAISTASMPNKDGKTTTFHFTQQIPIPSYLVALAVGALHKKEIGPRSCVWSEIEMVEASAFEFSETESFIQAAEAICGPYVWGRYDVLVLPPSFPYGGMENPCLTFVTPTLLAGDKSLASVVAHEISHSWMGNLVTSQTWEHFWMNEGFTVFLERKILRALNGAQQQGLHSEVGWGALERSVELYGKDHPYTCLEIKLDGVDPDDSFSSVPYEKGFNFLYYLQGLCGGEEVMNKFLRAHCENFKFSCVSLLTWKPFFLAYFKDSVDAEVLAKIDWELWMHGVGMPPKNKFDTTLVDAAKQLAGAWVANAGVADVDISAWPTTQTIVLLETLLELQEKAKSGSAFAPVLEAIDARCNFSESNNSELRFRWYTACIRAELQAIHPKVVQFLMSQGRMKFVRPLYRELFKSESGKKLAVDTFKANRTIYHSICSKMLAKDLQVA